MIKVFLHNLIGIDGFIIILAIYNLYIFVDCKKNAELVYSYFNKKDHLSNLTDEQKKAFDNKVDDIQFTSQQLLDNREKTNKRYAKFLNLTSLFPLLGMLGTVYALLKMGNMIGTEVQGAFFTALTSTFWGIIFALTFKSLDAQISYKIDDNEKHLEYLFNPKKGEKS